MIALGNVASVVVIGILYGFFSGACEYRTIRLLSPKLICPPKDISMLGPVLAALTDNMSELGYVFADRKRVTIEQMHMPLTVRAWV